MERQVLADDIVRYIENHIDSVPEMEALILLRAEPQRTWTAEHLGRRIYVPLEETQQLLQLLERKRLVAAESSGYRFSAPDAAMFDRVAAAYRANLVEAAHLIHSKSSASLREFARAFRLKE